MNLSDQRSGRSFTNRNLTCWTPFVVWPNVFHSNVTHWFWCNYTWLMCAAERDRGWESGGVREVQSQRQHGSALRVWMLEKREGLRDTHTQRSATGGRECARGLRSVSPVSCEWDYGGSSGTAGGTMRPQSCPLPSALLPLLLGLCSGTSFPTNINIGEWAPRTRVWPARPPHIQIVHIMIHAWTPGPECLRSSRLSRTFLLWLCVDVLLWSGLPYLH